MWRKFDHQQATGSIFVDRVVILWFKSDRIFVSSAQNLQGREGPLNRNCAHWTGCRDDTDKNALFLSNVNHGGRCFMRHTKPDVHVLLHSFAGALLKRVLTEQLNMGCWVADDNFINLKVFRFIDMRSSLHQLSCIDTGFNLSPLTRKLQMEVFSVIFVCSICLQGHYFLFEEVHVCLRLGISPRSSLLPGASKADIDERGIENQSYLAPANT